MKQLNESLNHQDMVGHVYPAVNIDRYKSAIGTDDDIITIDFATKGKLQADDLCEWFESGYDWVIDADTSTGEVKKNRYLVFVEINRRQKSPEQIIEMIEDLETLTSFKLADWTIKVGDQQVEPTADAIRAALETSPHEYRETHPDESGEEALNEWKQIAGVAMTTPQQTQDAHILAIKRQAGLI